MLQTQPRVDPIFPHLFLRVKDDRGPARSDQDQIMAVYGWKLLDSSTIPKLPRAANNRRYKRKLSLQARDLQLELPGTGVTEFESLLLLD